MHPSGECGKGSNPHADVHIVASWGAAKVVPFLQEKHIAAMSTSLSNAPMVIRAIVAGSMLLLVGDGIAGGVVSRDCTLPLLRYVAMSRDTTHPCDNLNSTLDTLGCSSPIQ